MLGLCAFTHSPYCSKLVRYAGFKEVLLFFLKSSKNICLYMIFDWLSGLFHIGCKVGRLALCMS